MGALEEVDDDDDQTVKEASSDGEVEIEEKVRADGGELDDAPEDVNEYIEWWFDKYKDAPVQPAPDRAQSIEECLRLYDLID